jgi:hypothetical protein
MVLKEYAAKASFPDPATADQKVIYYARLEDARYFIGNTGTSIEPTYVYVLFEVAPPSALAVFIGN